MEAKGTLPVGVGGILVSLLWLAVSKREVGDLGLGFPSFKVGWVTVVIEKRIEVGGSFI